MEFQMPLLNHLTMFSPFSVILLCMLLMWILEFLKKSVTLVCIFYRSAKEIIWRDGIKCNYFEVMLNKDEFLFSNNVPIGTQEASNNNMEASWVILSSQFLTNCNIWYP
jgi:hypothetical protein